MARGPLVIPSLAVLVGAILASRTPPAPPFLPTGLVAAGVALGGPLGRAVGFGALGLLAVWTRPPGAPEHLDRDLAVSAEGVCLGPWQRDAYAWSCRARLLRLSQGGSVRIVRARVWLSLGAEERPPPQRRFVARGYLDRGPSFHNGGVQRAGSLRLRVKSRRLISFSGAADWRRTVLAAGRERAQRSDGIALARALVLGDARGLDAGLLQSFRRLGLGHLLALSGLHVGILAGLALWVGRAVFSRSRVAGGLFLFPALGAVAFLALVGPRPAVARAVLMALLGYAALARGGRPQALNALPVVLAILAVWEPEFLSEIGFWLTASATAGIVWAAGRGPGGALATAVRVSCAAQLFTLPWSAPAFHLLSPAAIAHNLWAVPWTAFVLVLSCLWLAVTVVRPASSGLCEPLLEMGVAPFRWVGALRSGPWASIAVSLGRGEAALVAILGAAAFRRSWLALPAVVLLVGFAGLASRGPSDAELVMLDVGQGEAILVRDGRSAVLVDGGGWSSGDFGGRVLVPALARLGVRALDAVVLTHPDLDHCGGLADLLAYMPIDELWSAPGWPAESCALRLVTGPGIRWRPLWSGARRSVGRWSVIALHPPAGSRGGGNDRSVVLRVSVHGFSGLLTGDLEAAGERRLLAVTPPRLVRADLLKVAHHGSRSSTSPRFLAAVAPRMAWVSAGRANRFGHPHDSVLERLEAHGARVSRTDRDGLVHLRIDADGGAHLSFPGAPK